MDKKIEKMPTRREVLEDLDLLERLYQMRGKEDIINWILKEYTNCCFKPETDLDG